jgi:UDP-N-acetylmuramoyl-tripeptide--D-alanyl-D-alanine ligase
MILTDQELQAATRGQLLHPGAAGEIVTDTRRLVPGAWFLALRGDRFDGHDFVQHARAAQCAGVIVDTAPDGDWDTGLLVVPDTLQALQDVAAMVRDDFTGPVVGITGSAGKTTTRAMVQETLRTLGHVHATVGNLNNHIGVPLTLLATPPDADALVLELGMSAPREIDVLQAIGRPTHRLITNVGVAHLEGTGSLEGVAACKQELFDGAQPGDVLLINMDDPFVAAMPLPEGVRVLRYGSEIGCDVRLSVARVEVEQLATFVQIELPGQTITARIPSPGLHLALNATAAAAVAWSLRIPGDAIAQGLARYAPVGMRMRVEKVGGYTVLNDAYNANPASMRAALETLRALPGPRVAVLGDMLELGGDEDSFHAQVLEHAVDLDVLALAGPRFGRVAPAHAVVADDSRTLTALLAEQGVPAGAVVLLKGSRGMRMERVLQTLADEEG